MWPILGVVALLLSWLGGWYLRQAARWKGVPGRQQERAFEVALTQQKQTSTWRFAVQASAMPEFQIKPQGWLDGWFHRIGIHDEVQTGDTGFDERFFVASDHPLVRQALRFTPALRTALIHLSMEVSAQGWTLRQIRLASNRLWVEATHKRGEPAPDPARFLPLLEGVRSHLPNATGTRRLDPFMSRAALILALSTAVAISGAVNLLGIATAEFPRLVDASALWRLSLLLGPLLCVLLTLLALYWLGRSARSHYLVIELLTIGMFGVWAWTFSGLHEWNRRRDDGPQVSVLRAVHSTYTTSSRRKGGGRSIRYHLVFPPNPKHGLPMLDLKLAQYPFGQSPVGTCFSFELRPGALGWPWFQSMQRPGEIEAGCSS